MTRTVAISGVAGQLGSQVLAHARRLAGPDAHIVGLTRKPEAAPVAVREGCELRQADFAEPAALASALHGVDDFLMVSIEGDDTLRLALHTAAAQAAASAGVGRIVYTSFFDVDPASPSIVARVHRQSEEAIAATGCRHTFLRNGPYVDNIARAIATAARSAAGIFKMASGDVRMPFITRADLALAAAHALVGAAPSDRTYRLSGAELLSYQQLCELIGARLGRPVRHESMSDDDYRAELAAQHLAPPLQERRLAYVRAMKEGFMSALTDDFQTLTRRQPQPMREAVAGLDLSTPQVPH